MIKRLSGGNYIYYKKIGYALADFDRSPRFDNDKSDEERLKEKLRKRKERFLNLALNNDFCYFATITYDPEKFNNDSFLKAVKKQAKRYWDKYIIVPEYHKNGRLHVHCLLNKLPFQPIEKVIKGKKRLKLKQWQRYGNHDIITIDNKSADYERIIFYLVKYLTKTQDGETYLKNVYSRNLSHFVDNAIIKDFKKMIPVDLVQKNHKVFKRYLVPAENVIAFK